MLTPRKNITCQYLWFIVSVGLLLKSWGHSCHKWGMAEVTQAQNITDKYKAKRSPSSFPPPTPPRQVDFTSRESPYVVWWQMKANKWYSITYSPHTLNSDGKAPWFLELRGVRKELLNHYLSWYSTKFQNCQEVRFLILLKKGPSSQERRCKAWRAETKTGSKENETGLTWLGRGQDWDPGEIAGYSAKRLTLNGD